MGKKCNIEQRVPTFELELFRSSDNYILYELSALSLLLVRRCDHDRRACLEPPSN